MRALQGELILDRGQHPWDSAQTAAFLQLVKTDGFYHLQLPARPGGEGAPRVAASIRARCLLRDQFEVAP